MHIRLADVDLIDNCGLVSACTPRIISGFPQVGGGGGGGGGGGAGTY